MSKEELSPFTDVLAEGVMGVKNNWEFWAEKLEDEYAFQKDGKVWVYYIGWVGKVQTKSLIFDMLILGSVLHI